MSSKDKTRDKLMSSMRKTKEGINEESVESERVVSASKPEISKKTVNSSAEIPLEKPVEKPVEKSREKQKKVNTDKVVHFKSKRVWPD